MVKLLGFSGVEGGKKDKTTGLPTCHRFGGRFFDLLFFGNPYLNVSPLEKANSLVSWTFLNEKPGSKG